jgi:8-oxo-dGTP diphosphatase
LAQHFKLNYCPQCGHALADREAFGRVRRFCPACDKFIFREHKVAAGVLVERDGAVLLVRRRFNPRRGMWSFPAGFVDFGEAPVEAAVRECYEETGLDAEITSLLDVIAADDYGDADLVIIYRARVVGGALSPADDVDRVAFFPLDELPPLAFRATQMAIERV